jgi:hypothetical protein
MQKSSVVSIETMAAPPRTPIGIRDHKRFFSAEDDNMLRRLKSLPSERSWAQIADLMPPFTPRQLRERWINYLSPTIKWSTWTDVDDTELLRLYDELGPRWGAIGTQMGQRSASTVKNRWHAIKNRTSCRSSKHRRRSVTSTITQFVTHTESSSMNEPCDFSIKSLLV